MSKQNINNIINNFEELKKYINFINTHIGKDFIELTSIIQEKIDGLETNQLNLSSNDKGKLGKLVELNFFGQKPNCCPNPDLECGFDIKVTKFKQKDNIYSAKERLTITNIGDKKKISSFDNIINSNTICETKYFNKIKKIILFVFEYNKNVLECIFLGVVIFDYDKLNEIDKSQISNDFEDIKNKIRNNQISQKGQKYLHIHSHGSKNSQTKALGFKNNFVTKLFCDNHEKYEFYPNKRTLKIKLIEASK
jgi:hypothetical protein